MERESRYDMNLETIDEAEQSKMNIFARSFRKERGKKQALKQSQNSEALQSMMNDSLLSDRDQQKMKVLNTGLNMIFFFSNSTCSFFITRSLSQRDI